MEYENPKVPEDVNLPTSHPLVDFTWMLVAVTGVTGITLLVLILLADYLVGYVPFELETKFASSIESEIVVAKTPPTPSALEKQIYLQSLADSLIAPEPLPDGMTLTVHYVDDSTVNAFATLGGIVMIHQGLIDELSSENALAMVLAHEIEHVRRRHPLRAAGRGIVIGLAIMGLTGFSGSGALDTLASSVGYLSSLSFSREHENEADAGALSLLQQHYGHVAGADQLFEVLQARQDSEALGQFLSTHPLNDDRIANVHQFIEQRTRNIQPLIELPAFLKAR